MRRSGSSEAGSTTRLTGVTETGQFVDELTYGSANRELVVATSSFANSMAACPSGSPAVRRPMITSTGRQLLRDEDRQTSLEAIATPAIIAAPRRFRTRMHKASAGGPAGEIAAAREWMGSSDGPDESAWATFHLGIVLQRHGHFEEAEQRLREARSSGHATVQPAAAAVLRLL